MQLLTRVWAACVVLVLAAAVAAQPVAERDLTGLLEQVRVKHELPALGGAIVTTDGLWAVGTVGTCRAGEDQGVQTDLWHLGSCTKAMTATLIARLVEGGTVKWTTTLGEAIADVEMEEAWRGVTLEQLLTNRAGAPKDLGRDGLWGKLWRIQDDHVAARRALAKGVLKHPPEYEPGTKFVYSNANFALAGHVAETVTGTAWEDLMQREVFAPLGITQAGFGAPRESPDAAPCPRGHRSGKPVEPGPRADNPPAIGPAGTVHMPLAQWCRFITAHLRGAAGMEVLDTEGKPFLSRESWEKLHTAPADGYAMGWGVGARPWAKGDAPEDTGRVLTHNGSNTMWFCVTWLAPERGFAVLATTNTGEHGAAGTDGAASALIRYWRESAK